MTIMRDQTLRFVSLLLVAVAFTLISTRDSHSAPRDKKSSGRAPSASDEPMSVQPPAEAKGLDGLEQILLVSTDSSFGSIEVKPDSGSSTTRIDTSTGQSSLTYFRRAGEGFYLGPNLSYSRTSTTTTSGTSRTENNIGTISGSLALRGIKDSGKDQYVAFTGSLGMGFVTNEDVITSSGTTDRYDLSGSGLVYSGEVAFGQRLGRDRAYLIEVGVGYGATSVKYTLSGDATGSGVINSSGLTIGIAIGIGL